MKLLYAPWRSGYSDSTDRTKQEGAAAHECIFCEQFAQDDDDTHFIIKRFDDSVVMLNRYPYNAGHLLILPLTHHGSIDELKPEIQAELMWLTGKSSTILKDVLGAEGVNIGVNMGKAAGAGIPAHLHIHILPRWMGDTNFLPTLSETKIISYDMNDILHKLKKAFETVKK